MVSPTPPQVAYTLPPGINYSLIYVLNLGDPSRDSQVDIKVIQEAETKEQIP